MHIEPGFVAPAKVALANAGGLGLFFWGCKEIIREFLSRPWVFVKTLLAIVAFTLFMEAYSAPVGPSELHFVGAMAVYLTLGFVPTLIGFGVGLLLQGMLFNPGDLYHLGVNSLSLMVPLVALHYTVGKKYFDQGLAKRLSWARIVKLDAMYYAGVTGMVGFWLMVGEVETPFAAWGAFALSYLVVVACEPVITYGAIKGLKAIENRGIIAKLTAVKELTVG